MNYSKWCSRWGLSTRVSIDPTRSWRGGLSDTGHVRRTCKICSSTMWQWRGDSPPQDMPRSDFNSLALGTRQASGLGWACQKYLFVPYRELAYVKHAPIVPLLVGAMYGMGEGPMTTIKFTPRRRFWIQKWWARAGGRGIMAGGVSVGGNENTKISNPAERHWMNQREMIKIAKKRCV